MGTKYKGTHQNDAKVIQCNAKDNVKKGGGTVLGGDELRKVVEGGGGGGELSRNTISLTCQLRL